MEMIKNKKAQAGQALGATKAPRVDLKTYKLRIFGKVGSEVTLSWGQLASMPAVTRRLGGAVRAAEPAGPDDEWTGIPIRRLLELAVPRGDFVMLRSGCTDYSAGVPLDEVGDDCIAAFARNGKPLEPRHGGPLRAVMPGHHVRKNTLWLDGIEVVDGNEQESQGPDGRLVGGLRNGQTRKCGADVPLFTKR